MKFALSLLSLWLCVQPSSSAQKIQVLVLDAKSGRPEARTVVTYFCGGPPLNTKPRDVVTDDHGLAVLEVQCGEQQRLELVPFPPNDKEACGAGDFSMDEAVSSGYSGKPGAAGGIWCPSKVSERLKPVPGQITIFVKKPTWYQAHIAG